MSLWQVASYHRLCLMHQPILSESVPIPSTALKGLLHSDDLYIVIAGATLAPYGPSKLRVARGDLQLQDIEGLVSDGTHLMISAPHEYILKSSQELARNVVTGILRGLPYCCLFSS